MTDHGWYVAAAAELFFAAVAMHLCVLFAFLWFLRREDRYLIWFSAWSWSAALLLATQAALFLAQGSTWATALVTIRAFELGALTALVVPPVYLLAGRRVAWWLVAAIAGVYLVRGLLTAGTDLLWAGEFDDRGLPTFEPLRVVFTAVPAVVLALLVPRVRRIRDPGQRRPLYAASVVAIVLVGVASLQPDRPVRELATGAWSLPMMAALAAIGMRRVRALESGRRRLLDRQAALLHLGGVAAERLPAEAAERLRADLGRAVTVAVTELRGRRAGDPGPGEPSGEGEVSDEHVVVRGHRFLAAARVAGGDDRLTTSEVDFVRSVLQLVASGADRAAAEESLRQAALYDLLTGLPNRMLLTDRLEHALDRLDRHGGLVAVLFCDLDEFKIVNDTLGHATGDTLLTQVAGALARAARSSDTVSRYGGDEFVVVVEELDDPEEAFLVAGRMRAAVAQVVNPATGRPVRMSVGAATAGPGEATATRLKRAADLAMYRAKERSRHSEEAGVVVVPVGAAVERTTTD